MDYYKDLREYCKSENNFTYEVIDSFLLHYAAERGNVAREFFQKVKRFKHVEKELDKEMMGMITAQYIVHRVFRENGLIYKYINHAAVKDLEEDQQRFLRRVSIRPWRFTFCVINKNIAKDIYKMTDVFRDTTFLLYSDAITKTLEDGPISLWFLLIGNNGECWQSYGPVVGYESFDEDDIFFYATELDPEIFMDDDLVESVEENPVPYMMLVHGSAISPLNMDGYDIVLVSSTIDVESLDIEVFKGEFKVEQNSGVYRLTHNDWSTPPHFTEVFYDSKEKLLQLAGTTEEGYEEIRARLGTYGCLAPPEPEIRVHISMLEELNFILKKEIDLIPYSKSFGEDSSADRIKKLEILNEFVTMLIPSFESGKDPDIEKISEELDIDPVIGLEFYKILKEKMRESGSSPDK